MKLNLVCVGTRMPSWVEEGVSEYRKRLPRDFELSISEVAIGHRGKNADIARAMAREGDACLKAVPAGDFLVSLDVTGRQFSTEALAEEIRRVRDSGRNLSLLVGGPDGLARECLDASDARWSLSALTFPHPIVRIVLAEQLYRVWSLLNSHPYHRA